MDSSGNTNTLQQPGGGLQPQTATTLQQPGSGLQPQESSLQITSSQTINQINALDSGDSSIPLAQVSAATTTTSSSPTPTTGQANWLLIGLIGVAVLAFVVFATRGLLRQR